MHFLKNIPNDTCQISLFKWNGKYIVKFEMNQLEQTYKIGEIDVTSQQEVEEAINEAFTKKIIGRFENMADDWYELF